MLDRIELRRQADGVGDERVVADFHRGVVRVDVTLQGKRTKHEVADSRFASIVGELDGTSPRAVPTHRPVGAPVGVELILSSGMTQSVYRWVAATPASWEPLARAADALLQLARELSATE